MIKYIALLRAINVGGRVVKMEDLRRILAIPGFMNIKTYIQSGNVIFEHKSEDKATLQQQMEITLLSELNYEVKVLLRTVTEMKLIIENNPFVSMPDEMGLHVMFMSNVADPTKVMELELLQTPNEKIYVNGNELYLLCRKGAYSDTVFNNKMVEKKLGIYATTRNWNTVNKLV